MAAPTEARPTLDQQLHALAAPLRERLEEIEAKLAEVEQAREQIRADRDKVRRALRVVDPSYAASKPGPKPKGKTGSVQVSAEAVELVRQKLAALDPGEVNGGVTASELARRAGWPYSQSYTAAVLKTLHERGTIRLDRVSQGGAKHYRLV